MAVNNANLHKLPLKSTLNMNRFENEINDWKQYINLNSPVYGGVLSNFYKKNIQLAEGHKFITYDKKNRLWTKKYNEETTNTDVYCGNRLITSFNNKTAEMQELEKDYGIIGGTKEYPIYDTDYPEYEISTCFVNGTVIVNSPIEYNFLLVLYYKRNEFTTQNVDIYRCENGEKTLVKTFTNTISSDSKATDFFINGFINKYGFLILSILPNGKVSFDELFLDNRVHFISLINYSEAIRRYTEITEIRTRVDDSYEFVIPNKCTGIFERYPLSANGSNKTFFVKDNTIYQDYDSAGQSLPYKTDTQFKTETNTKIRNDLLFQTEDFNFTPELGFVDKDKLLMFCDSGVANDFGINYGLGEYIAEINKDSDLHIEYESVLIIDRIGFNSGIYKSEIYEIKNYIKRYLFVGEMDLENFSPILKNFIGDYSDHTSFNYLIKEAYKTAWGRPFENETTEKEKFAFDVLHYGSTPPEDYYLSAKNMFGFLWNEIAELNIKFDITPINISVFANNTYKPYFHGYYYSDPLTESTFRESPDFIIGSDSTGKIAALQVVRTGISLAYDLYYDRDLTEIDFANDDISTKCAKDRNETLYLMGKVNKICVINFSFEMSSLFFQNQYLKYSGGSYSLLPGKYKEATRGCVKEIENYKISIGELGITYTLGEPFAITRGIMNLYNQILKICSTEIIDNVTYIYFINSQGFYCCIKSVDLESAIESTVVDDFIIFKTSDYGNHNFNAIDMSNIEMFPTSLDWNSRNSLFLSGDCGLNFEDDILCYLYNEELTRRKRESLGEIKSESIVFISSVNERFLSASTNHGIGANWCSSLVGVQYIKTDEVFINDDLLKPSGYLGTGFYFSPDDYISDYEKFFINVYLSSIGNTVRSASACFYRFSIPTNNPDLEGLEGQVSFPFENNVLYNLSLFDEIFTSRYYPEWFVRVGEDVYNMQKNGTTLQPVFAYELLSGVTVDGIFVINGSAYGYTKDYIVPLSYSNGVVNRGDPVLNKEELFFIEASPYAAYFYSYQNRSVFVFTGDNTMTKLFESNRIENISKAYYNPSTQDIWCSTNDGTLIIHSDNTFIKLNELQFKEIGILKEVIYILSTNDELILISYNFDEDFEKESIELETEFFGIDDFTTSVNDCVYIRLVTDTDHNDFVGDVELMCKTLTQISRFSETKKFHIEKSTWDKDTNTILLRYQPKYQEGIGFGIKLKSDFPISGIYINSTPVAIANSKHNV